MRMNFNILCSTILTKMQIYIRLRHFLRPLYLFGWDVQGVWVLHFYNQLRLKKGLCGSHKDFRLQVQAGVYMCMCAVALVHVYGCLVKFHIVMTSTCGQLYWTVKGYLKWNIIFFTKLTTNLEGSFVWRNWYKNM